MSEKPVASLLIAAVAMPIALLCCLGPVVLGSFLRCIVSWFSGLNLVVGAGSVLAAGLVAYGLLHGRKARHHPEDA